MKNALNGCKKRSVYAVSPEGTLLTQSLAERTLERLKAKPEL